METATLTGVISDANGGVVPDVEVTATRIETGTAATTKTNGAGIYFLTGLMPGHYHLNVRKPGFKEIAIKEFELFVQDKLEQNFSLEIGSVSESVTVNANDSHINTTDATVSTVVDRQFVGNMPLNGRSFQSLIQLAPGVVLTKTNANSPGQFSVNGQRADGNYLTVDGVSANIGVQPGTGLGQLGAGAIPGVSAFGSTSNLVSVDALQEFRIQTSTYAPEFGRQPGGQVSIVTRSGTDQFRGTLFEYFRNDALDANDWFANANRLRKPPLRQNDFGGVLGGPIIKDKTFFFFSYEGLRLHQPQTSITEVPSLASRQKASARIRPFFDVYPVPNGPETINGLAQFSASYSNPSTLNATGIRIDHTVSSKLVLFGRYNRAPSKILTRLGSFGGNSLNTLGTTAFSTQTLTVAATWSVTSKISNEFRVNWSRNFGTNFNRHDDFGGAVPLPESLMYPSFASKQNASFGFFMLGGTNASIQDGLNSANVQRQINMVNSLAIISGSHQLKFGVDYRKFFPILDAAGFNNFIFVNGGAVGALTGVASIVGISAQPINVRFPLLTNFSAYGQDSWRVNDRLTVTYGLRWELNPPGKLKNNNDAISLGEFKDPSTIAVAPRGTPMYKTTYNDFAPRVGLVYQLSQRRGRETVLRGGFGLFYDLGSGSALDNFSSSFPFVIRKPLTNIQYPVDPALLVPPTLAPGAPVDFLAVADPNLKLPYIYQWNLAVEHSLGTQQTVSASYVAAVGRRLLRQETFQNPNPNFITLLLTRNTGSSAYHALQLQYRRRLSRGLQALVSYGWSHSIDNASDDSVRLTPSERVDPSQDRGASDFDVRHSLSAAVTYDLPAPALGRTGRTILNNWSVDTIFQVRSATPVNVVTGTAIFGISNVFRPDLISGIPLYINDPAAPGGRRFNDAVDPSRPGCKGPFCAPPASRQGTLGRNALRGFPVNQVDLAVRRQFNITERLNLQFRAELFNLFNHPNFADPIKNLNSGLFGRSTQMLGRSLGSGGINGGFSPLYQVGGPRSIQLALRLSF